MSRVRDQGEAVGGYAPAGLQEDIAAIEDNAEGERTPEIRGRVMVMAMMMAMAVLVAMIVMIMVMMIVAQAARSSFGRRRSSARPAPMRSMKLSQ